ncbi:hypothetical protein Poly51_60020 [Rubripirellula tenax]|uniref:Uncharacterized protein n=1 Tax=Rubripirellula tenax TaxID=2528015 RepID=A0A5C6E4X9_9BACT|nr:hypothetical protein [Rubripirellula tenax]TWU44733.1 hypothetical protein Poly51_60020 [Rubripirellula tenax]
MKNPLLILASIMFCMSPVTGDEVSATKRSDSHPAGKWYGAYVSVTEASDLYSAILRVDDRVADSSIFKLKFVSKFPPAKNRVGQDAVIGGVLIEGNKIYIPIANARREPDGITLSGLIQRYTRVKINGHTALLSDEAMESFAAGKRLDGYGVLIQRNEHVNIARMFDSHPPDHPSISLLYDGR